jgi:hypothetical protein
MPFLHLHVIWECLHPVVWCILADTGHPEQKCHLLVKEYINMGFPFQMDTATKQESLLSSTVLTLGIYFLLSICSQMLSLSLLLVWIWSGLWFLLSCWANLCALLDSASALQISKGPNATLNGVSALFLKVHWENGVLENSELLWISNSTSSLFWRG